MRVEEGGVQRAGPMEATPRLMREVQGVASAITRGHQNVAERTVWVDCSREHWLDEKGMSRLSQGQEAPDP
jgi:hypothetical protein